MKKLVLFSVVIMMLALVSIKASTKEKELKIDQLPKDLQEVLLVAQKNGMKAWSAEVNLNNKKENLVYGVGYGLMPKNQSSVEWDKAESQAKKMIRSAMKVYFKERHNIDLQDADLVSYEETNRWFIDVDEEDNVIFLVGAVIESAVLAKKGSSARSGVIILQSAPDATQETEIEARNKELARYEEAVNQIFTTPPWLSIPADWTSQYTPLPQKNLKIDDFKKNVFVLQSNEGKKFLVSIGHGIPDPEKGNNAWPGAVTSAKTEAMRNLEAVLGTVLKQAKVGKPEDYQIKISGVLQGAQLVPKNWLSDKKNPVYIEGKNPVVYVIMVIPLESLVK